MTTAGGTGTSGTDFKFVAPVPTITSFTPTTGTTSGTTTVTISGTGFSGTGFGHRRKFGTTTAKSYTVTSSTTIKAVTKPHVAGTVKVKGHHGRRRGHLDGQLQVRGFDAHHHFVHPGDRVPPRAQRR